MLGIKPTKPNHAYYFKICPLTKIFKQVKTLNTTNSPDFKLIKSHFRKIVGTGAENPLNPQSHIELYFDLIVSVKIQ